MPQVVTTYPAVCKVWYPSSFSTGLGSDRNEEQYLDQDWPQLMQSQRVCWSSAGAHSKKSLICFLRQGAHLAMGEGDLTTRGSHKGTGTQLQEEGTRLQGTWLQGTWPQGRRNLAMEGGELGLWEGVPFARVVWSRKKRDRTTLTHTRLNRETEQPPPRFCECEHFGGKNLRERFPQLQNLGDKIFFSRNLVLFLKSEHGVLS